jgi:hypothetical protein
MDDQTRCSRRGGYRGARGHRGAWLTLRCLRAPRGLVVLAARRPVAHGPVSRTGRVKGLAGRPGSSSAGSRRQARACCLYLGCSFALQRFRTQPLRIVGVTAATRPLVELTARSEFSPTGIAAIGSAIPFRRWPLPRPYGLPKPGAAHSRNKPACDSLRVSSSSRVFLGRT